MNDKQGVYGVDVSKAMLVIGQYESEALIEIGNAPEPIAAWLASVPAGSIVAMEATGVYHRLLAHLAHAAGMVVYVLNPQVLKHYARAIGQRGKTDGCDARMIARYVEHERAKLRRWQPPAVPADMLSRLLVRRRALVSARQMLCQSLSGMPILKGPRQALLASFKRTISSVDLLIRAELARVPEMVAFHRRLMSIVGIGEVVATQLVAALTALHFTRADSFVAYTGLDPRPDDSGQHRGKRRLSKRGPALLRCLLYNAGMSAANSKLFKPLYTKLRARGFQSTEAIVILARKLARIAFALYKSGQTFDAQKHFKTA
ncbi:IS110 family transposase [Bosea sp. (in: a-proteobacteria)]|uniref:IS110 family transposase n=1 Tax=Bosea sp. (in: a-proteobacteria) TaxID=1871050 RepID=UPI0025C1085E|nr:IS110 family transposase [Bosea sp. (in: a-proteobacteria)]